MYEPYADGIGRNLMMTVPLWRNSAKGRDNWQAGPWDRVIQAKGLAVLGQKTHPRDVAVERDHF
jgi:hypothetical protein